MNETAHIYLDNNSTTALDPEVFRAMQYDFGPIPRNPSSIHSFGQGARNELTKARRVIADSLGVFPDELIFTSGASEANNFVLKGFCKEIFPKAILTTRLEHSSVFGPIEAYRKEGGEVIFLPTDQDGYLDPKNVQEALHQGVGLIALMAVNNETGVCTDIEAIGSMAEKQGIPFFSDGVALLGKEPFKIGKGIGAMSFSGHKLHGPKGIGLCYLSQQYSLPPLICGGGQENNLRGGTHNLSGALGLSKAIELLGHLLPQRTQQMEQLRNHFESTLLAELPDIEINGSGRRVCNTSNIAFTGLDGESLLMNLDMRKIAASHGSACSSGSLEPSRVLMAMGLSKRRAESSIRFSLSRLTSAEEIDRALTVIIDVVKKMRA